MSKIAYFLKFSIISEENIFLERDEKKEHKNKLETIDKFIKENNFINNKKDIFEVYYFIHDKIFLGLDSSMKINSYGDNEETEESFRIILNILFFISQYYKYLLDNKDDFIKYENNKNYLFKNFAQLLRKKWNFYKKGNKKNILQNENLISNQLDIYIKTSKKFNSPIKIASLKYLLI